MVAATETEIFPYLKHSARTDILITGVGSPACMYALTKNLQIKKYDFVLQAGIAGTFRNKYALGETVAVKQEVFADLGISESGSLYSLFDKGYADSNIMPYTNKSLLNPSDNYFALPAVNAITVNMISDNATQTGMFINKYNPDIESMEGAAFHYVCISEGIRFMQLRSISNFVGDRVKSNWKMKESIQSLNENLTRVIDDLQNKSL